ncbi:Transmembrane protease serine 11F [Trichostrongylus colubriformis]|uniref:Transmembrane protease serine 11F n=1 Tax=Trichostrongylus colubriformis TaxID=6319 RepID=A0AAN8EZR6_TRICO
MLLAALYLLFPLASSLRFCDDSPAKSLLRVIGGSVASIGDYPWQAAVVFYGASGEGMICGATVVDEYWVLTAAHCIMKKPEKGFILTGLRSLHDPQHTHHVDKAVIHPGFDENTIIDDIALVKSESSLLKAGVSSVCLTRNDSHLLSSDTALITGFGLHIVRQSAFDLTMGVSDVILTTILPIIPQQECRKEWSFLTANVVLISDRQVCAGSKLHGSAPGDSGGPLLVKDRLGRMVQVGITSFGAGGFQGLLDQGTYPGVYTRVSPYINWMERVISSDIKR